MSRIISVGSLAIATTAALLITGCSRQPSGTSNTTAPAAESGHGHQSSAHGDDNKQIAMTASDSEARKLYLTPGGKYTADDIQANGNVIASVKFKGVKAEHDLKPKSGEKVCPITLTKANPKFAWMVDGKSYEFCCPPCVEEFVGLAKEKPDEIMPPEFYRQK